MAISFSFKNEVQYVRIDGGLIPIEEAAIRLRLDQKINHGRMKILIDIKAFAVQDKNSVRALHSILQYALARGCIVGLFGIKQTLWILVAEHFPKPLKIFELENEALAWIEKELVEKTPPEQKNPEAEYKEKALKELLAKYEIYQAKNDYDPFLLKKLDQDYKLTLTREPLFALRRAYKNISTVKDSLNQIEVHCRSLADQLMEATKIRKIPLTPIELEIKAKAIQEEKAVVESEVAEVKAQIDSSMASAVDFRKRIQSLEDKWRVEFADLQKQIDEQNQMTKNLAALLKS